MRADSGGKNGFDPTPLKTLLFKSKQLKICKQTNLRETKPVREVAAAAADPHKDREDAAFRA